MKIDDWAIAQPLVDSYREVQKYDLQENLAELGTFGFTVIPPEKMQARELFGRLQEAVLRVASERTGVTHTVDGTVNTGNLSLSDQGVQEEQIILWRLLDEDPSFQEGVIHPATKCLLELQFLGDFQLSLVGAIVKGKGDPYSEQEGRGLHTDAANFPEPLPAPGGYSHVVNTNWVLTDYTMENGPLCVVPGSHKWCRHPKPGEGLEDRVGVEAPAGSVIMFHGNLWHSGLPKTSDGLRLTINNYYCRTYSKPLEDYRDTFAEDQINALGPYFRQLLGENDPMQTRSKTGPTGSVAKVLAEAGFYSEDSSATVS